MEKKTCSAVFIRAISAIVLAFCCAWAPAPAAPIADAPRPAEPSRAPPVSPSQAAPGPAPRIGLVLSGGGARGLAHVGVLKVLERERIAVDVVVGTSMGAIIGGLYASGMSAQQLEAELLKVQWDAVFASRVDRQNLSQRRKEQDFEISPLIELGMRDGELRVPLGALSGRGLENLLRRYTLRAGMLNDFDALPIPFRAVATDMETGQMRVLAGGDLASAMRSSMSVPGVFAPTELDGRILGDGGLVNNLPVDVAREMGVDLVIAVNIGTPLAPRSTLGSVGGLTAQMINILTEQNVQRSLALLTGRDVLLQPDLGTLTSSDFARTPELMALGQQAAELALPKLTHLRLSPEAYAAWRRRQPRLEVPQGKITAIAFEGSASTRPQRLLPRLESQPGQEFDPARAERDVRLLAASGDYRRSDYVLRPGPDGGNELVFDLEDKSWGPNYFHLGLDLSTNFSGESAFNLKLSHDRHWLDENGAEWRNRVQIGEVPSWFTELYRPLDLKLGTSSDWFAAGWMSAERRRLAVYDPGSGALHGRYDRRTLRLGIDLGQPWGRFGEVRVGLGHTAVRDAPELLDAEATGPRGSTTSRETGVRLRAVVDQLDDANFPRHGYRFSGELWAGKQSGSLPDTLEKQDFRRMEFDGNAVGSWGPHTLNAYARLQSTDNPPPSGLGRYRLGGFHQLSGYKPGQLQGNAALFGRLAYMRRVSGVAVFTRGSFLGASVEAGNTWARESDIALGELRGGGSVFYAADTGIGPFYLGLTYARRGSAGVYLFIGRP